MRIFIYRTLSEYYQMHPDAKTALEDWFTKTEESEWKNFSEMKAISNDREYQAITKRIDKLLEIVTDDNYNSTPEAIELDFLSTLVEEYDRKHYPIVLPKLSEVLKLRMYEMDINETELAKMLGVSPFRISEYLSGKDPSLMVARIICEKLNISANVVLGVSKSSYSKSLMVS